MTVPNFKVAVIGSGAGGAPAAARLAAAWGDGVALFEAGPHLHARDFTQIERQMVPRLYAQGGTQATADGSVGVLQGRLVGGSTVINDAVCFDPPPEMNARWRARGATVDVHGLAPYVTHVKRQLGVSRIPKAMINRNNYLVGLGAARLGWAGERLWHNSPGCVQCGFRHLGCAYDAKRGMNLTYVPRAIAAGARLFAASPVERIERVRGAWRIVVAGEPAATAERVVLAAGVVQTPTLLLRSGLGQAAGDGLNFHLETLAWGDFDDPVDGFNGIPMSYGVMAFADVYGHTGPGFVMEGVGVQPMAFAVQPQAEGDLKQDILSRWRHLAGVLPLIRADGRGRVRLRDGMPEIRHALAERDAARVADFYRRATELFMAAGARRVLLAHRQQRWVTAPPERLTIAPGLQYLYTAHPFGGACRGTTCDAVGRVRGAEDLWVLDASAFPEALGVNPMVTIAALALEGAERILAG